MGPNNYDTKNGKYKQLKESERWKIEAYLKVGLKSVEIAEKMGRNRSTITREIKRGKVKQKRSDLTEREVYRADYAQRDYEEKQGNKGRPIKIKEDKELKRYIREKIRKDRYSPGAIMGEIEEKGIRFRTRVCIKTVYNYIHSGEIGIKEEEMIYGGRRKRKYRKVGKIRRSNVFKSIEERPKGVKGRKEFGHWEIDVVKGTRRTKACLLTLSERKTRQEIICKMNSCKGEEVDKVITEMEKRLGSNFRKIFKTITADNGSEFLDWEELERSKIKGGGRRTKIYYAHPYSSFERGTNENQNRMIRRFINKGTDIGKVTRKTVRAIQNWINSYPRAILNYKTSNNITSQFLTKKTCEILGVVQ